ncbi:hypothetical protein [Stratiformator vulcanicus]|uniref:hypothetical protein n=1 Tax=Stratiformator vulcanicus TaxID=2527980 RepID=UPI00119EF7DC|nr:hypothetical protein [Stratiformator vulcanicus]
MTLRSVSEAENVNAIDSKQSLPFAGTGLTVVFGYNGSGKSGYGRVLRRACRARNKGDAILPNVLQDSSNGPASAVITYAVDDVEQPPEQWIDGQRAIDRWDQSAFSILIAPPSMFAGRMTLRSLRSASMSFRHWHLRAKRFSRNLTQRESALNLIVRSS